MSKEEQLRSIIKDAHIELEWILTHTSVRAGVYNVLRDLERKLIIMQVAKVTDPKGADRYTKDFTPEALEAWKAQGCTVEFIEMSEAAYQAIPATRDAMDFFAMANVMRGNAGNK